MTEIESREEVTAKVKEHSDIVQIIGEYVDLKRSGTRYLGLCPFHGEKTPSFSIHPGQQFFHCFGCGESGDVFSFVMKYHNLSFPEALKQLAERYHIDLPQRARSRDEEERAAKRAQLYAVNGKAADLYRAYLVEARGAEAGRAYLRERGVDEPLQARFGIGYAPATEAEGWNFLGTRLTATELPAAAKLGLLIEKERGGSYDRFRDRIVFPIADTMGRICGFGGRIVGPGQPKYLNSPESEVFNKSRLLLGLYQVKEEIRRQNQVVLVEGNFDLVSLVGHGLAHVVAPLGTALTREQLRLVKRFTDKVILLFDSDNAGKKAAVRAAALFFAEQLSARVALLPPGHDPDSFVRKEGLAALNRLLEAAQTLPEFVFDHWAAEYGLGLDGKSRIVEEMRPLITAAASPLQRSLCLAHFAEKLGIDVRQLEDHFRTGSATPPALSTPSSIKTVEAAQVPLALAQKQMIEFMLLHPRDFTRLQESGLRECLTGTVGEILFLQMADLLSRNPGAEPEELLGTLPRGAERDLVADLLANASLRSPAVDGEEKENGLGDLLKYLEDFQLKKASEALTEQLLRAQQEGNLALLDQLMAEKLRLVQRLHGEHFSAVKP
jgi:DNA primase